MQALHSVIAQVLTQSLRTSHAFQVEVFLLEDEEGRVDAGIVGGYLSGIGGHFDSIVIGHECPDGSLILFGVNFQGVSQGFGLPLFEVYGHLFLVNGVTIGAVEAGVGGDKDVLYEVDGDGIDVSGAQGVVNFDFDVDGFSVVADVSCMRGGVLSKVA